MLKFDLYRIKIFPLRQGDLFYSESLPRVQILQELMILMRGSSSPSSQRWKIGSVVQIDDSGFQLQFGRLSIEMESRYRENKFTDILEEAAPYVHILIDLTLQVCAIEHNSRLARFTDTISRALERQINELRTPQMGVQFKLDTVYDPEDFLKILMEAKVVTNYSMEFARPNTWDENMDFRKPFQKLVESTRAMIGKTTLRGRDMDKPTLEGLTHAAAASGNKVTAKLEDRVGNKKTISLSKNQASISLGGERAEEFIATEAIIIVREKYDKIRNISEDGEIEENE